VRIIAGAWRGRAIEAPAGTATRPTSDRAREGLFSMLTSRIGSFDGLAVADLFAGSGALGLEALSRGAAHCLFIDNDTEAVASIRRNCETFGVGERVEIRQQSVEHAPPPAQPCDIIFLDPPYGSGLAETTLARLTNNGWLASGGLISLETQAGTLTPPPPLVSETERRFGRAHLMLLRAA